MIVQGRAWGALAGAGALVLITPAVWARTLSAGRIRTVADVPSADVALVLGAAVRQDGQPSRVLRGRLIVAQSLYEAGKAQRILVSGSAVSGGGHSEPVVMRNFLVAQGVPADAILLDESGVNTHSSALAAARDFGLDRLTVVSSDFHLPRAVALCRRAGIDAYGVGHDAAADGLHRVAARGRRRELLATIKAFWRLR